jgi:thiol-disulfide isomerase/thioredoxin
VAPRRPTPLTFVVATALALVAALGVVALFGGDDKQSSAHEGSESYRLTPEGELPKSVSDVTLASLHGGADRKLGELLGTTPIVVNFFASWCVPCVSEMPAIERVHQELGHEVQIIGIAYQDSDKDALATVAETGVTYPTFGDSGQDAITYFGGLAMPTSVFIDADGKVRDVHSRAMDERALRAKLHDLFGIPA